MDRIQLLSIQFVPFLVAVIFHEFGHGWMAKRWGDNTAALSGRLTLNPLAHIDPIGTVLIPMVNMLTGIPILIGWAKPVPINPGRFKKYRPGLFWVAAAGPLMNALIAVISAILAVSFSIFLPHDFYLSEPLVKMCSYSIQLNFAIGLFNLVPIPPLDGSKMIESVLSYELTRKYEAFARYGYWLLWGLLIFGAFNILYTPILWLSNSTLGMVIFIFQLGGASIS